MQFRKFFVPRYFFFLVGGFQKPHESSLLLLLCMYTKSSNYQFFFLPSPSTTMSCIYAHNVYVLIDPQMEFSLIPFRNQITQPTIEWRAEVEWIESKQSIKLSISILFSLSRIPYVRFFFFSAFSFDSSNNVTQ